MRKIALVDLGDEFTGSSTYLQSLVVLLSGNAEFWVLKISERLSFTATPDTLRVVDLGFSRNWGRPFQIPLSMMVLAWLKIRHGLDTVWVNGYPEIALMPWARLIGCQAVATRHLTLLTDKPKWHWIRSGWRVHFLYELLAPAANKIVCVSEVVAESLRTCVSPEKLAVIPNWVPVLPDPVKLEQGGKNPLRLLFVGRLAKHKGMSLLLDAMRLLGVTEGRRGVSLTVVGDGEERAALEKEAANLDVQFIGFRSDTSPFYKGTDVFVNPTLGPEGLPLVSLDAMSYGLPCIFSDLPVHKEISRSGESALLFQTGSADGLMKSIDLLIDAPELARQYGRLARTAVEANHGAQVARSRYIKELGL